ncbi:hypothetical protein GS399_20535, partial [Pedobacter sp. HMF7647]
TTIKDNDLSTVTVAATKDGAEGATPVAGEFTFTLSNASSTATTVNFTVTGTAISGADYSSIGTSVTIPAGATTYTLAVPVLDDNIAEGTETVILQMAAATSNSSITASTTAATMNITDDDVSQISVAANVSAASEPSTNGNFRMTLSKPLSAPTTVSYTVSGTATAGSDYTALSGTVTINAGEISKDIPVTVIDDNLLEPSETVILTLSGTTNSQSQLTAVAADKTATVTIADDDQAVISIAATTQAAEPSTDGLFTITMDKQSSTATIINYTVSGTATAGTDYTALSGTVTILANTSGVTIPVQVKDDNILEGAESVIITLSTPSDPKLSLSTTAKTATVTITDNDASVASIAVTTHGAESGPIAGVFTVTLTNPVSQDTHVTFTLAGTATEGADYTAVSPKTVTILAGATTGTITIPVLTDALIEGTETVLATLTSADNGVTISPASGSATMNISDSGSATVSIAAVPSSYTESAGNAHF